MTLTNNITFAYCFGMYPISNLNIFHTDTIINNFQVIHPYTPIECDELELHSGDYVYISGEALSNSPDGWVEGTSWLTGLTGLLPESYTERTAESDAWTLHRKVSLNSATGGSGDAKTVQKPNQQHSTTFHNNSHNSHKNYSDNNDPDEITKILKQLDVDPSKADDPNLFDGITEKMEDNIYKEAGGSIAESTLESGEVCLLLDMLFKFAGKLHQTYPAVLSPKKPKYSIFTCVEYYISSSTRVILIYYRNQKSFFARNSIS